MFARNLADKGFFSAMLTTFNGYYIWGLYLLEQAGRILNGIFFGGEFVHLAKSLALTSYLFLGFVVTLPLLLFRKYFPLPVLLLISLFLLFVPLRDYDYAIIGGIGNLKFAFIFIGFLLLVYRHLMPEDSKKVYLVDAGILICAYTNITVYALMPFALLRYMPKLRRRRWTELKEDRSFVSLVVLGLLLLPQLLVMKLHGVPEIAGYLDAPFNYARTVEIFLSRSYLYGLAFPFNKYLNDAVVILLLAVLFVPLLIKTRRTRAILLFGLLAVAFSTVLFVTKRTGVSDLYSGYQSGGPDQFFYAQNWMIYFVLGISLYEVLKSARRPVRFGALGAAAVLLLVFIPKAGTYGNNSFMADSVGIIYANAKQACDNNDPLPDLAIYPSPGLEYEDIDRQVLCTETVKQYRPENLSLGLAPADNNYISGLGSENSFTQTFVSPHEFLAGISVYFSTFDRTVRSPYDLVLYDASCTRELAVVHIPTTKLRDNAFYGLDFQPQAGSAGKTYCFSILAKSEQPEPLAVQLSQPDMYSEGQTRLNDELIARDIVFKLAYE